MCMNSMDVFHRVRDHKQVNINFGDFMTRLIQMGQQLKLDMKTAGHSEANTKQRLRQGSFACVSF